MNHEEFHMSTYRPAHQPWHDKVDVDCTCEPAWSERDMVDDRCWYHRVIEVLDEYGFGELLGETLYRYELNGIDGHFHDLKTICRCGLDTRLTVDAEIGLMIPVLPRSNGVAYAETDEEGVPDSDVNGG